MKCLALYLEILAFIVLGSFASTTPSDQIQQSTFAWLVSSSEESYNGQTSTYTTETTATDSYDYPGNIANNSYGFYQYLNDAILLVGAIGNLFAFVIFHQKDIKNSRGNFYLKSLSICDGVMLIVFFVSNKLKDFTSYGTIYALEIFLFSLIFLSKYIIVGMCIERLIAVCFPLKAKVILSTRKNMIYLITSSIILTGLVFSFNIGSLNRISVWVSAILNTLAGLIILICNVAIVIELAKSAIQKSKLQMEVQQGTQQQGTNKVTSTTAMLLVISFAYLILTLPIHTMGIVVIYFEGLPRNEVLVKVLLFANMLATSNHALNFFFYFLGGKIFREATKNFLVRLFQCGRSTAPN